MPVNKNNNYFSHPKVFKYTGENKKELNEFLISLKEENV